MRKMSSSLTSCLLSCSICLIYWTLGIRKVSVWKIEDCFNCLEVIKPIEFSLKGTMQERNGKWTCKLFKEDIKAKILNCKSLFLQ
ncbi:Uncharacterized protein TCM_022049 [Theobroma cacao]|uniref:Uncharacterized protein n=1 Tax=Theobroma cacao TaxID=3641 RepID=A0A061ERQ4_THECC|nr:Uncharacterized protein TCM_022049 [Theobroma cacao]